MAKKIRLSQNAGYNTKTSIVDLLKSKGQGASYEDRKKLYEEKVGKGYTGSEDQNVALIRKVSGSTAKTIKVAAPAKTVVKTTTKIPDDWVHKDGKATMPFVGLWDNDAAVNKTAQPVVKKSAITIKKGTPVKTVSKTAAPAKTTATVVKSATPSAATTESGNWLTNVGKSLKSTFNSVFNPAADNYDFPTDGFVVDKGTNMGYIVQGGKVQKSFPVLTGAQSDPKAPNAVPSMERIRKGKNFQQTNTGDFYLRKIEDFQDKAKTAETKEHYDNRFSFLYPEDSSLRGGDLMGAVHETANPTVREPLYNKSADKRYVSQGCVNCQKPDWDAVHAAFGDEGGLVRIIDSRNKGYENITSHLNQKRYGGKMQLCHQCGGKVPPLPQFAHGGLVQNGEDGETDPWQYTGNWNYGFNIPQGTGFQPGAMSRENLPMKQPEGYGPDLNALYQKYPATGLTPYSSAVNKIYNKNPIPGQEWWRDRKDITPKEQGYKRNWVDWLHLGEDATQLIGGMINEGETARNEAKQRERALETMEEDVYDKDKYGLNPASFLMEYGGEVPLMRKGGWIKKAAASIKRRGTEGKCTPITKPGCTGRAKALAKTFKKIARKHKKAAQYGGYGSPYNNMIEALHTMSGDFTRQNAGFPSGADPYRYRAWGQLAPTVMKEGWKPTSWSGDTTEYSPGYEGAGTHLYHGNKPMTIRIVGNNNNNSFDVVYRDPAGQRKDEYIMKGVAGQEAHDWFTNYNTSPVAARQKYIEEHLGKERRTGGPSSSKAKEMLRDGTANGQPLTARQKRYFGWIAGGKKQMGGMTGTPSQSYDPFDKEGELPEMEGAYDMSPEVWAETGEVARMQNGNIVRIADEGRNTYDHGETPKMPGTPVNGAESFLEATSTKKGRTAMADKVLKVSREVAEQLTGYKPKMPLSHATLLDQANQHYTKMRNKMGKRVELQLKRGINNEANRNSVKWNMDYIGSIPGADQLYDTLFNHQEGVKQQFGISDEPTQEQKAQYTYPVRQYGGLAQTGFSYLNNIVNQGNNIVRGVGKKKGKRATRTTLAPRGANPQGSLFTPEWMHILQDYPEMLNLSPEAKAALPQMYDRPQHQRSSGFYGEKDWNMDDFKQRHAWYFKNRPDWNPSNPQDVKDFQESYNHHAKTYTGKDYFVGSGEQGIDTKFGEYTYNAPGLNDPQIVTTRKPVGPATPPTELTRTPTMQIGLPPDKEKEIPGEETPSTEEDTPYQKQKPSYFPLQYSDIASARHAYLNSMNRDPETMIDTYMPRVQYKTTDPTRQLREVDYGSRAALQNAPGGTQGMGFKSQIMANALNQKSNILSQYDNANSATLNRQEDVNADYRAKENMARTQNLGSFIDHYLQSRAVAGDQKQQALDSYYSTVNKNRMFNNMTNLMDAQHYTLTTDEMGRPSVGFDDRWSVNNPYISDTSPVTGTTDGKKQSLQIKKASDGNLYVIDPVSKKSYPISGLPDALTNKKRKQSGGRNPIRLH